MIAKCNCKDEYQDKLYGVEIRVFTENKQGLCRCTKCGKPHPTMKRA